ncbi:MAG: heterodisulfide reductase subunit C [Armatimonadetes bacterium]|nr:heterodisulfide reductase subunit C [Armatimonadota bacterium]
MADDKKAEKTLLGQVLALSGVHVENCYQCGKCTAGCPVAFEMEIPPQQMMRMVQLNLKDRALNANTVWVCASCETCSARCPMDVKVADVMDALRRIAIEEGVPAPAEARTMAVFHREFLGGIRRWGRLNEHELIGLYKLHTGKFMDDVGLGIRLFGKQKIRPWHFQKVKRTEDMARLFEAALSGEKDGH